MLSSMTGSYTIRESENPSFLNQNLKNFDIFSTGSHSFKFTNLENILHESSVDNGNDYHIGLKKFSSQINENTILQETSFNREIVNCENGFVVLTSEDIRDELFPENEYTLSAQIKFKVEIKIKCNRDNASICKLFEDSLSVAYVKELSYLENGQYVVFSSESCEEYYKKSEMSHSSV